MLVTSLSKAKTISTQLPVPAFHYPKSIDSFRVDIASSAKEVATAGSTIVLILALILHHRKNHPSRPVEISEQHLMSSRTYLFLGHPRNSHPERGKPHSRVTAEEEEITAPLNPVEPVGKFNLRRFT